MQASQLATRLAAAVPPCRQRGRLIVAMAKPWRPSMDDVDSISRGGPAKVRGTGSRRIPHRLNAEERTLYDLAKKKGFLAVRGTAYRKFRHGNPLPNIFRQWCDSRGQLCVVVEQDPLGSGGVDRLVVDLAPLRVEDTERVEELLTALAAEVGLRRVGYGERPPDALPFNILPPDDESDQQAVVEAAVVEQAVAERLAAGSTAATAIADAGATADATADATAPEPAVGAAGAACWSRESDAASRGSGSGGASSSSGDGGAAGSEPESAAAAAETLRRAVAVQAEAVRQLKADLVRAEITVAAAATAAAQRESDDASPAVTSAAEPLQAAPHEHHQQQQSQQPQHQQQEEKEKEEQGHASPQPGPRVVGAAASEDAGRGAAPAVVDGGAAAGGTLRAPRRSPLEHYYRLPIWQIHAVPLFFEGGRAAAKEFAGQAVQRVAAAAAAASASAAQGAERQAPAAAAAAATRPR
ncbi:hypothetical protein PLESTM_001111500 [Pleodorina starrii]|nr:hypothetical protein PLESTM_001111500 [Pleodorina starrii]